MGEVAHNTRVGEVARPRQGLYSGHRLEPRMPRTPVEANMAVVSSMHLHTGWLPYIAVYELSQIKPTPQEFLMIVIKKAAAMRNT